MDNAMQVRRFAAGLLSGPLVVLCLAGPVPAGPDEKADAAKVAKKVERAADKARQAEQEREGLRHFQEELAEYAELHAKQVVKLGLRESPDPQQLVAEQDALAHAIQTKRAKAQPGDIFRIEVQAVFRRLIAEQLNGPDGLAARKAVLEGNPGDEEEEDSVPVVVRVNAQYPPGAARSTVPPSVLLTLPPLPECLHYRFVGRDLVLVDSVAQIIVDFLPAATPDLTTK
jgi:hypothetical protein